MEFLIKKILNILPTINDPDPILTLLGTLSILFNRIKFKNSIHELNKKGFQIIIGDKYFN